MLTRIAWWTLGVVGLCVATVLGSLVPADPVPTAIRGGLSVALVALAAYILVWAVRASRNFNEEIDLPEGAVRERSTFAEIGNVETLAANTHHLLAERERWVYRRVEQIRFVERTIVRRRISIDFEIPSPIEIELQRRRDDNGAAVEDEAAAIRHYVPISVLRNWPPVINFDLRDHAGGALALLSKSGTNDLDERILRALTSSAFGDVLGGDLMGEAGTDLGDLVHRIVHGEGRDGKLAFKLLSELVDEHVLEGAADPVPFERLMDIAALLCENTLLWIDVTDEDVGARRIVKLAYDEPVSPRLLIGRIIANTLNFRSLIVSFDAPHVGDSNSYHLEIDAPPAMIFVDARLDLSDDSAAPPRIVRLGQWVEGVIRRAREVSIIARGGIPPRPDRSTALRHTRVLSKRVHLYAAGHRTRAHGLATVRLTPERAPMIAPAVIALLAASLVAAFDRLSGDIYTMATQTDPQTAPFSGAVAILLLAPAQLGYALARAENYLPLRQVAGVRMLAIASVVACVACAGLLTASVAVETTRAMDQVTPYVLWATRVIALLLVAAVMLPRRRLFPPRD